MIHSEKQEEIDYVKLKICSKCKKSKQIKDFYKNSRLKLGVNSWCKQCNDESSRAYLSRDRSKANKSQRKYADKMRLTLRSEVIIAYGGFCKCCGESEVNFLAIDHIYNDGNVDRKLKGKRKTYNFYSWLKRNNFPQDRYQLLCHNCNSAKGFYGKCPHNQNLIVSLSCES